MDDLEKIKDLEKKYAFVGIILGLPINMNGTEGPRCQSTRSFATKLSQMTNHFICLWDEDYRLWQQKKVLYLQIFQENLEQKLLIKLQPVTYYKDFLID